MSTGRSYDHDYKVQAVILAREIGSANASKELCIPKNTMYSWMRSSRIGTLDIGDGDKNKDRPLTPGEELAILRKKVREQEKQIKLLQETNEFLEEASAFFAAHRQKSTKRNG